MIDDITQEVIPHGNEVHLDGDKTVDIITLYRNHLLNGNLTDPFTRNKLPMSVIRRILVVNSQRMVRVTHADKYIITSYDMPIRKVVQNLHIDMFNVVKLSINERVVIDYHSDQGDQLIFSSLIDIFGDLVTEYIVVTHLEDDEDDDDDEVNITDEFVRIAIEDIRSQNVSRDDIMKMDPSVAINHIFTYYESSSRIESLIQLIWLDSDGLVVTSSQANLLRRIPLIDDRLKDNMNRLLS